MQSLSKDEMRLRLSSSPEEETKLFSPSVIRDDTTLKSASVLHRTFDPSMMSPSMTAMSPIKPVKASTGLQGIRLFKTDMPSDRELIESPILGEHLLMQDSP